MRDMSGISCFWSRLQRVAYGRIKKIGKEEYVRLLRQFIVMLWDRTHLGSVETPVGDLIGKRVLDLGCGAGAYTAMLRYYGARVVSLDISHERAVAAGRFFVGPSVVADMRFLPFRDRSFDLVYSNGVIHHAPNEHMTVSEIRRVLKNGGLSTIMIYARNSFLYRVVLWPIRGLLMGGIFKKGNWLGRATEWLPKTPQEIYNPYTSVFSEKEARELFRAFKKVRIRKNSFVFEQIPIIGKLIGRLAGRWTGYNEGGIIAYGAPWRNETRLELWLGQYIGFCLNIRAEK